MQNDYSSLQRFAEQQADMFEPAFQELRAGKKYSHWMWYIFPQLRGLGRSRRSYIYGIADLEEAKAYLDHPVLGQRLIACCRVLLTHGDKTAEEILGVLDAIKLRASMTLFALVSPGNSVFHRVLDCFFGGNMHERTIRLARDEKCFVIVNGVLMSCTGTEETVVIPEGVTTIGETAFSQYENLQCVTLPKSLRALDQFAFLYCENLRYIAIAPTVEYIGKAAFKGCKGLADSRGFVVVRHILHDYCGDEADIRIPEGVCTIGYEAFYKNKKLRTVTIPDCVTAISDTAFACCSHVTIRANMGSYGESYAREHGIAFALL